MADKSIIQTGGGQYAVNVAAGTLVNTTAVTGPGRLCRVSITTVGSVDLQLWDSVTSTGATTAILLGSVTGAAAVGAVVTLDVPIVAGIMPLQITNTPGVCISYTKDTPYGT